MLLPLESLLLQLLHDGLAAVGAGPCELPQQQRCAVRDVRVGAQCQAREAVHALLRRQGRSYECLLVRVAGQEQIGQDERALGGPRMRRADGLVQAGKTGTVMVVQQRDDVLAAQPVVVGQATEHVQHLRPRILVARRGERIHQPREAAEVVGRQGLEKPVAQRLVGMGQVRDHAQGGQAGQVMRAPLVRGHHVHHQVPDAAAVLAADRLRECLGRELGA